MKSKQPISYYVNGVLNGKVNLLSQTITLMESRKYEDNMLARSVLNELMPHTGKSIRLGITGAPGVGKSTFINKFGPLILEKHSKLAVLAVDPSSSHSSGSIMGDKTRMEDLAGQDNVFVRPSPAGKTLGGVASRTREVLLVCEAAGYDFIIIETVGVGQSEYAVKNMVDYLLLLLSPSSGDELQGIKRGIVEIADGISITKADGSLKEAAKKARKDYQMAMDILGKAQPSDHSMVTTCSALENNGLDIILSKVTNKVNKLQSDGSFESLRSEQMIKWLHEEISNQLNQSFYQKSENQKLIRQIEDQIRNKELSPIGAAYQLFK